MTLQVLLLMAGAGSRFARGGWTASKPLIDVRGEPMFVRALEGLAGAGPLSVLSVVRQAQVDDESIDRMVAEHRSDAQLVVLPELTGGAAYSALAAVDRLKADRPVVVLDCDLRFTSPDYLRAILSAPDRGVDGVLLTFSADHPRYSFVRSDGDGLLQEIVEKRVISDRAVAGAYWFGSAARLADAIRSAAREVAAGRELYMSDVVRAMLESGAVIEVTNVTEYESYGTPEELLAATGRARA